MPGDSYPGHSALVDEYEGKCLTALDAYSRRAAADPDYQVFVLYPTQETWDQDDHRVACITATTHKRTGSVTD